MYQKSINKTDEDMKTVIIKPEYQASGLQHSVWIPVLQSVFVGILGAWLAGFAVLLFKITAVNGWTLAGFVFPVATLLWWYLFAHGNAVYFLEQIFKRDFSGDGHIGKPEKIEFGAIKVTTPMDSKGLQATTAYLQPAEKIPYFVQAIDSGEKPLAGSVWGDGKYFTRSEWNGIVSELVNRELAEYRVPGSPKQGIMLTEAGERAIHELAQQAANMQEVINSPDPRIAMMQYNQVVDHSPTLPAWHDR